MKKQKRNLSKIIYLTHDELTKLLQSIKSESHRNYAIMLVGYSHGLRAAEVGLLQLEDFDLTNGRLKVHRIKSGISAAYKVDEEVYKALKNWIAIRGDKVKGALFPTRHTVPTEIEGRRGVYEYKQGISRRQVDTLFKWYAKGLGMPISKCHFHTLRHTLAIEMVRKQIPLAQIQDRLGHRSLQSTKVYLDVDVMEREKKGRL